MVGCLAMFDNIIDEVESQFLLFFCCVTDSHSFFLSPHNHWKILVLVACWAVPIRAGVAYVSKYMAIGSSSGQNPT